MGWCHVQSTVRYENHTGGDMSFIYGLVHCKSRKKINTKRSTEAILVGVNN